MGVVLVFLGAQYLRTGKPIYKQAQRFWTRIFALNFAIGVASGIVMEFQFGTNLAAYSRYVGDVFGSALAAEGIFAFFLESGFLAVLVFGWNRVGPKMHFFSTLMVAIGSIFSSVWIVVANSWQQTPAGFHLQVIQRDGKDWLIDGVPQLRAEITDFWQLVFNPSTVHRLSHVLIGCFIMGAFFIMSISAWYLVRRKHEEFAKHSFRGALLLGTVASIAILFSGHMQAKNVYEHQPAKLAAFEGHYETGPGDLALFGWPDDEAQKLHAKIAVPGMLSFLLFEDTEKEVLGLDKFRPEDRPPVFLPFFSYHLMIAIGSGFIALTLLSSFLLWRGTLFEKRWLMWVFVLAVIPAVLANQTGWIAAEVGRQPWVVQAHIERDADGNPVLDEEGFVRHQTADITYTDANGDEQTITVSKGLRTDQGISEAVAAEQVWFSLVLFGVIYLLLGFVWVFVLDRKIKHGPEPLEEGGEPAPDGFLDAAAARAGTTESMTGRGEG
jgi:cytochrome d ubiquinol oxidase subunit I